MKGVKMIARLLFLLAFCMSYCLAAPISSGNGDGDQQAALKFLRGITWVGPVHPDGVNHTFHGTIVEIINQIAATPGFNPSIFKPAKTSVDTGSLEARDTPHYNIYCDRTSSSWDGAYIPWLIDSVNEIKGLGGACYVDGVGCHRFGCSGNASLDLCNTRPVHLEFTCTELARIAQIMVIDIFKQDYAGKINACTIKRGDKKTASYYNGKIAWSPDEWWFVQAYAAPCLRPVGGPV
ncbi:hypothetical protein ABW21_db0200458 [Orbilia brochopaga]|nr:hypothetical protein ABW21_db0200458 [Drechslerella brochopaga]